MKPLDHKQRALVATYRDNTTSTPEQCARNTGFPIAEVRAIYAEGGRCCGRIGVDPQLIIVTVPGAPVAKGRPRITARGGFARAYTPPKTVRYEDLVRIAAYDRMNGASPVLGQVAVSITAYVQPPKSMRKRDRELAAEGLLHPITRPDADNYAKAALDGCNGILFKDDSQVTDLIVRKRYSDRPRRVISMEYDA